MREFSTRWELIIDLFDELQEERQLNCAIGPTEEDHIYVLDQYEEQGIDLQNERELFIFVLGMCNIVEVQFRQVEAGSLPVDELVSSLAVLRSTLAILRPFLPLEYFTRFLE